MLLQGSTEPGKRGVSDTRSYGGAPEPFPALLEAAEVIFNFEPQ